MKWTHNFTPGITTYNDQKMVKRMFESAHTEIRPTRNQIAPLTKEIVENIFNALTASSTLTQVKDSLIIALAFTLLLRHDEVSH